MSRAIVVAIWLFAASATGGLLMLAFELARAPRAAERMAIEPARIQQARQRWARWTVTEQLSAHNVLIAHVETRYLNEASSIARQLAEPLQHRYAEILIYFHRPGRPDTPAPRRVQWTRTNGYVETVYLTNEELRTKN